MASWVALIAALLSIAVTLPFALLQGVLTAVGLPLPRPVVQLLQVPLSRVAALVALAGVAVQTGVLLEQYSAGHVGSWLNSLASRSSSSTSNAAPAQAAHLTSLALESYPRTLSLVLDDALALPVPAPGSGITFSPDDVAQWERDSAAFRVEWVRLADEVARSWIDLLDWAPSSSTPPSADVAADAEPAAPSPPSPADRHLSLSLIASELALVQARNPTRAIYASRAYSPADSARDDARQASRARRAATKRDAEFEQWLEGIFAGAEAARAGAAAAAAEGQGDEGGGAAGGAGAMRREMLDVPVGEGPGSATWRSVLRTNWEAMYAADKGGVMGEVAQHLAGLVGDDDDDDGDAGEAAGAQAESEWMPSPLPLMAHRLVRDQLSATLDAAARSAGWDLFPSPSAQHDAAVLPPGLDALPLDRLALAQRAITIDRAARTWAQRALGLVRRRRTPPPQDPTTLPSASRSALLRASPLARFLRSANALFALPRERTRLGVRDHVVARAVFALEVPAVELPRWERRAGEGSSSRRRRRGGCSAVALEVERRRRPEVLWEGVRSAVEGWARGEAALGEGGLAPPGAQVNGRDEL